ncbi:MAG: ABC-2 family transporter protein [Planctomycetes bacterium ADurb.Bin126]|nr:MAG: ABC-2 family transporter protein [Planctomycetes bacterium ADurb.Bin126]HOD83682.1 hypothetical protein [Phycisphaerae bacterium]HQL75161.1 hypothetical protein [Phycisphaerae bacterium]
MTRFVSISRTTFLQTIRQPIYFVLTLVTLVVLVMTVPLSGWTMGGDYHKTDQRMLEAMGLATLLVSGLLISAFSASSVLTREIEDRTALTVISKPVSRATFFLGKFAGVALAVLLAVYLCSLIYLLTVRHRVMPAASDQLDFPVIVLGCSAFLLALLLAGAGNWWFNWSFTSSWLWLALALMTAAVGIVAFVGKEWVIIPFGEGIRPVLLQGVALVMMAVLIFVAAAVAVSTRLGQMMTLLVCVGLFLLGSWHQVLFARNQEAPLLNALRWLVPDLGVFDIQGPVTNYEEDARIVSFRFLGLALGYCLLYVGALLALGTALFQRRELESPSGSSALPSGVALLAWAGRGTALLAALWALALLSTPGALELRTLLTAGGLLAGGLAAWIFWGCFSRGARWSWYLASILLGALFVAGLTGLVLWKMGRLEPDLLGYNQRLFVVLGVVLCGVGSLAALLPRTRRHFK